MAKISLRVYNREIEGIIDGGQIDEAVAHCLHILRTFPMHIETYRLLGKAFLEARRYGDATDIFQRVLMAVPDDFVSHVGMSIIRDDESKFDEAIWHMERAYQMQPSNLAIQGELRRLYGRRDGVEPPKIRLTRDALANMYAQGDLYNQAITEIRTIMAEDPARADLQVMLARAYFRAGQKVEATEMCANLLKKYPNCLDALRIMAEILPGTARAENTQVYRGRIRSLDPYAAFVTGSVFQSDQVADAAVNLERLEYQPGAQPATSQPNWAASLGIKLEGEKAKESVPPEWLSETSEKQVESVPGETLTGKEDIPDWIRSAGWSENTGEAKEGPVESVPEEAAAEPISQSEVPDWLKAMAPPGALEQAAAESEEPFLPPAEESTEAAAEPAEGVPDWLKDLPVPAEGTAPEAEASVGVEGSPAEESTEAVAEPAESVPDWLKDLSTPAERTAPEAEAPVGVEESPAAAEEPVVSASATEVEGKLVEAEAGSVLEGGDALAWLEALAARQGARADELLTSPENRPEGTPEWVEKLANETAAHPPVAAPAELPVEGKPVAEELEMPIAGAPEAGLAASSEGVVEDETITTWLKTLGESDAAEEIQKMPAAETEAQPAEELPDWLKGLEPSQAPAESTPEIAELPEWLRGESVSEVGQPAPSVESAPAEEEPAPEGPQPVAPEEWVPETAEAVSALQPVAEAPSAPPVIEEVTEEPATAEPVSKAAGILSPVPEQSKESELLAGAQIALEGGQLNQSMQEYAKIIKKRKLLEEVIHDLREAIYRHPVDVIVWQTLGDAYMRANQLQEALDAYTKAEELLR